MSDLLVALGLVLVLEGVLWGCFPGFARELVKVAATTPERVTRLSGLGAVALGFAVIWLIRG